MCSLLVGYPPVVLGPIMQTGPGRNLENTRYELMRIDASLAHLPWQRPSDQVFSSPGPLAWRVTRCNATILSRYTPNPQDPKTSKRRRLPYPPHPSPRLTQGRVTGGPPSAQGRERPVPDCAKMAQSNRTGGHGAWVLVFQKL